jgi:T5SS/PEP-CTERM-associated repeat protein
MSCIDRATSFHHQFATARPWRRTPSRTRAALALIALSLGLAASSQAVDITSWNYSAPGGSSWFLIGNWDNGIPTNGLRRALIFTGEAIIDLGGEGGPYDLFVGSGAGSTGRVTITGAGSTLAPSWGSTVGCSNGIGTIVATNGGTFNSSGYSSFVGIGDGGVGTVYVSGIGSKYYSSLSNSVGLAGGTGTVRVSAGGLWQGLNTHIGSGLSSTGLVDLAGSGTAGTNYNDLVIGTSGGLGSLVVTNGATATLADIRVGTDGGAGFITAAGAGSRVTVAELLFVGTNYGVGTIAVANGAQFVHSGVQYTTFVGHSTGGVGHTILAGAGSLWTNTGAFVAGSLGGLGNVTVSNGARLVVSGNFSSGIDAGSTGIVTLTGPASVLVTTQNLILGSNGFAILTGTAGSSISGFRTFLGQGSAGSANVSLAGTGSTLSVGYDLFVGSDGGSASLELLNGATASVVDNAWVGTDAGATGSVTVAGAGSHLQVLGLGLTFGYGGVASLTISNGGTVTCGYGDLSSGTALVDGSGSLWTNESGVNIGSETVGLLTITNGGHVTAPFTIIGPNFGHTGTVVVAGSGSRLELTSPFSSYVGYEGGDGSLTALDGAVLSMPSVLVGFGGPNGSGVLSVENATIETANIAGDTAPASVTFNGAVVRATEDSAALLENFLPGDVLIESGGLLLNADGHDVSLLAPMDGVGSVAITGNGIVRLYDDHTFLGDTTVSNGTLAVNGSVLNNVIALPGATLAGAGFIGGYADLQTNTTLAPGDSAIGALSVAGDLTLAADCTFDWEADDIDNDYVVVDGTLTFPTGTNWVVSLVDAGLTPDPTASYLLFDAEFGTISNFDPARVTIDYTGTPGWSNAVVVQVGNTIVLTNLTAPAVPTPFQNWQTIHFGSTTDPLAAPGADPDGDGIINLFEYAFFSGPNDPASRDLPTPSIQSAPYGEGEESADFLAITFNRDPDAIDVTYYVEESVDLIDWYTIAIYDSLNPAPGPITELSTVPIGTPPGHLSLRVRVELP